MSTFVSNDPVEDKEKEELDLTTTIKSDLYPSTQTLSSTPPFSRDSLSDDVPTPTAPSPILHTIINSLDRYVPNDIEQVHWIFFFVITGQTQFPLKKY